jgi:hypothetical protein
MTVAPLPAAQQTNTIVQFLVQGAANQHLPGQRVPIFGLKGTGIQGQSQYPDSIHQQTKHCQQYRYLYTEAQHACLSPSELGSSC